MKDFIMLVGVILIYGFIALAMGYVFAVYLFPIIWDAVLMGTTDITKAITAGQLAK